MTALRALISRNIRLFFKDKGLFFTSLITPAILLVLYISFLAGVYRDSFAANMPMWLLPDKLIEGAVAGQLVSSLLAVSCVTVAFCSNMLMVQDKVFGARRDLTIAPIRSSVLAAAYFIANYATTLMVCFITLAAGLVYIYICGWYLAASDVIALTFDVLLMAMFGTALSSFIGSFLSSQGQISAVGTIISAGYGFISGAYMPISQFGEGLQKALSFLPGTYGTVLMRRHTLGCIAEEFAARGVPARAVNAFMDATDCNLYFLGTKVSVPAMYIVVAATVIVILAAYIISQRLRRSA